MRGAEAARRALDLSLTSLCEGELVRTAHDTLVRAVVDTDEVVLALLLDCERTLSARQQTLALCVAELEQNVALLQRVEQITTSGRQVFCRINSPERKRQESERLERQRQSMVDYPK